MKKWLLVLGMITCILGASACGKTQQSENAGMDITEEDALNYGEQLIQAMDMLCSSEQFSADKESMMEDPMWSSAISSWEAAMGDMGSYEKILEKSAEINGDGVVIHLVLDGTDHDANVEIILDEKLATTSVTTNVIYSLGELMEKAALNTILGMGTVFVILILISLIISCFTFIPKIQNSFRKKSKDEEKPAAVDHTIAQIVEKEELSDDLELVAVISAAIAAGEGAASTDGFVVRSIRKRRM